MNAHRREVERGCFGGAAAAARTDLSACSFPATISDGRRPACSPRLVIEVFGIVIRSRRALRTGGSGPFSLALRCLVSTPIGSESREVRHMSRTRTAIIAAAALAATLLVTPGLTEAKQTDVEPGAAGGEKTVVESTTGSYIVVMEADPLIAEFAPEDLNTPTAQAEEADIVESHDEVLEESGAEEGDKVQDFTNALNGFSAILTHDEAIALAGTQGVKLVLPDELRQLVKNDGNSGSSAQPQDAGKFLGLTGRGGAWESGVTGEGVVVGVIDSGIWPEHPSFADDGSYPAPSIPPLSDSNYPVCDFGNTAHNPNDAPFTCNNKLIGARQTMDTYRTLIGADPDEFDSARDDDGHGTHTASTAAGNAGVAASMYGIPLGTVSGIAPRGDHRVQGARQPRRIRLRPCCLDRPGGRRRCRRDQLFGWWRREPF